MFSALANITVYLRSYYDDVFNWVHYVSVVLILTAVLYLNYYCPPLFIPVNFLQEFCMDYLVYFLPYALAFVLPQLYKPRLFYLTDKWFCLLLLLAPAIFALRSNSFMLQFFTGLISQETLSAYWLSIARILFRTLLLALPVGIIWWIEDRDSQKLYGINALKSVKPFFIFLALMIPVVLIASLQPDFARTYPVIHNVVPDYPNASLPSIFYEAFYGLDFLGIEFFFRGFLILAFIRICGPEAILPAACFYCCIHLEKPLAEAISSFFGGLLLGIISYHLRSIWGAVIVHVGIAWLMEIFSIVHAA